MLFNELIEKESIESVAETTNISAMNLEYLQNENFEKLNRVKALGFLLILEREYKDIDVAELRESIKLHYDSSPTDNKVVMVALDSEESGFSFFKTFILLAILGGGYYLYSEGKLDSLFNQIGEKEEFFDDKKALENNVSNDEANKVVVGKSSKESISIETPVAPKEELVSLNDDKNTSKEKVSKNEKSLDSSEKKEENPSVEAVVKEVGQAFLAKEENASITVAKENEKVTATEESVVSTITINPTRGMLWYGFINLDNKKRREFMKKSSTPFNIANSRWLLVTGHGFLDIVANDKTVEIADSKKHYFYIDSAEIREIDRKEFRELNGNRGW